MKYSAKEKLLTSVSFEAFFLKIESFIDRIKPFAQNTNEKKLLEEALRKMLSTSEGREIFEKAPNYLKLIVTDFSKQGIPYFQMAFDQKDTIQANFIFVSDENKFFLPILLAHEIEHSIQPKIPKGLTFEQYTTLYKLREIDSRLTEMQVAVELGIDQDFKWADSFRLYGRMYHQNYRKFEQQGYSRLNSIILSKQKTRAYFIKEYLKDTETETFIEPRWKAIYEKYILHSITTQNLSFKTKENQTTEERSRYDKVLNFYLNKAGLFLQIYEINRLGLNKNKKEITKTIQFLGLINHLKKSINEREISSSFLKRIIQKKKKCNNRISQ